jgi:cytochrome P450
VHFCLDAALARMEARTVINTMLHRIPDWNTERIGGTGLRWMPKTSA